MEIIIGLCGVAVSLIGVDIFRKGQDRLERSLGGVLVAVGIAIVWVSVERFL